MPSKQLRRVFMRAAPIRTVTLNKVVRHNPINHAFPTNQ